MTKVGASRAAAAGAGGWLAWELLRGPIPWTPAFLFCLALLWSQHEASAGRFWRQRPALAFFLAALAFYLSTFRWRGGDDIPNSIMPFAILRHGTFALDPVIDPWLAGKEHDFVVRVPGHILSVYPVMPGLLALPVYLIPVLSGATITEQFLHNLAKLSAALMTAGSVAAFYRGVVKRCSREWAAATAAFYALGTSAFSLSSQALWQHGPQQLGLALGLWGLSEAGVGYDLLCGLGFGLAVACRPDSIFIAAAAAGYLAWNAPRRLPGCALGAAPPLLFTVSYWLYYTGRLSPPEYAIQGLYMVGLQPSALLALLASPTRGLLWFSPVAAFGVWAGLRRSRTALSAWLLAGCAATWLFIACYSSWTGGMTFGPRYLAGVALVLVFLSADLEKRIRADERLLGAWVSAGAASILVQALGAYLNWPGTHAVGAQKVHAWDWRLHPISQLFAPEGGLGGLPWPARAGIAVLVFWAFGRLAARLKSRLAQ